MSSLPRCTGPCNQGRKPCPTPEACTLPHTLPGQLGEDESGLMERLERSDWAEVGAGIVKGVAAILVLLIALFAGGELREWYREHQAAGVKR